jgi:hypothetical protein
MSDSELLDQAETLQNLLVAYATGSNADEAEYRQLRQLFVSHPALSALLPRCVRTCRSLSQFWGFIKGKYDTYRERRQYLWDEFAPLLEALERGGVYPSDEAVSTTLERFDTTSVHGVWSKALDRRSSDPEGAVTMARTLLETVCKHILDDLDIDYTSAEDLPKLYRKTAGALNLAPSQHTEDVFKQILGGCTAVVEGLGALRNRLSDSHGKGPKGVKPAPRHAELAVNLAGSVATYLIDTWEARQEAAT